MPEARSFTISERDSFAPFLLQCRLDYCPLSSTPRHRLVQLPIHNIVNSHANWPGMGLKACLKRAHSLSPNLFQFASFHIGLLPTITEWLRSTSSKSEFHRVTPRPLSDQEFGRAPTVFIEWRAISPRSRRGHRVDMDLAVQSPRLSSKTGFHRVVTEFTEQTGISPCSQRAGRAGRDFAALWPSPSSPSSLSSEQQTGQNRRVRFFLQMRSAPHGQRRSGRWVRRSEKHRDDEQGEWYGRQS